MIFQSRLYDTLESLKKLTTVRDSWTEGEAEGRLHFQNAVKGASHFSRDGKFEINHKTRFFSLIWFIWFIMGGSSINWTIFSESTAILAQMEGRLSKTEWCSTKRPDLICLFGAKNIWPPMATSSLCRHQRQGWCQTSKILPGTFRFTCSPVSSQSLQGPGAG